MLSVQNRGFGGATAMLLFARARVRMAAQIGSIVALSMIVGCSDDPTRPDPDSLDSLPIASTTVVAAVEFITPTPFYVPATCGGSLEINCVNGVPGQPASFNIARGPITTEWIEPEQAYSFSTTLAITSVNISAKASGITCAVAVNSAAGTSTTVNLVGNAEFSSHTTDGVVNRVDIQADVNGLESDDVTLTGGVGCAVASGFKSLIVGAVTDALSSQTALCGAPGPALLKACPEQGAAARRELRRR